MVAASNSLLQRLPTWQLNLLIVVAAVALTDVVVVLVELALLGEILDHTLMIGAVSSLIIASMVVSLASSIRARIAAMQRLHLEQGIARAQSHLDLALETAQMLFWELNWVTGSLVLRQEQLPCLGLDSGIRVDSISQWLALLHPDDQAAFTQHFQDALPLGAPDFHFDYRVRQASGAWGWVHSRGRVKERNAKGEALLAVGGTLNITSRKHAELALGNSLSLFKAVIDNAPVRIFWKDKDLRFMGCNPIFAKDAGLDCADDLIGKFDHEMSWGDQADAYTADDRAVMASGAARLSFEEPQTTPDGRTIWLRTSKVPLRDADQEIIGVLGMYEDITAQRADQEKLKISALVLANCSEAMILTDANNRIMEVNPAFTRLTGYAVHEAVGQKPSLLKSGKQSADFYQAMWKQINSTGCWQGELWSRHKNGALFAEWLTISTLYDEDARVLHRIGLFSDITDKKRADELIWTHANFDSLTGLPNRRMFLDRLAHVLKKARRAGFKVALMFLDLDSFKAVNDMRGHAAGDTLLVEAARRIAACARDSDTVARIGGDEFTVILSDLTDTAAVERIANAILSSLAQAFALPDEPCYLSASIGVALYPQDASSREELLGHADQAMYAAKDAGGNRFSYFSLAAGQCDASFHN